jgi:DNA-directed RNA polymerase beta' subunit
MVSDQHLNSYFFFFLKETVMILDILNISNFVKINNVQEITSPYILAADGNPDPEGIFSYEIFGRMGSTERREYFGFVGLKRNFLHPLIYNMIYQMYRNLPAIINGERFVKVVNGKIVQVKQDDKDAETGVDFFYNNWDKIRWDGEDDSKSRLKKQSLFNTMKRADVFVDKWLIIPAMYRDINLHDRTAKGKIEMDEINSFYIRLINGASSESITYTSSYMTQANVQQTLVDIHDSLTKKQAGKEGIIRKAIMGKTVDYAAVSVISAPRFNSNTCDEQMIPYNYIGIPLYTVCALFYPQIVKGLEDVFHDVSQSTQIILDSDVVSVDEKIEYNVDSESLTALVKAYVKDKTKRIRTSRFTLSGDEAGRFKSFEQGVGRPFTITDLLYRVAADVVFNKHVLSTRFPITDAGSTIINKVKILTTEKTVDLSNGALPGSYNFEYMRTYPFFPIDKKGEIIHDDVNWIDTTVPNNSFLSSMGGDFDGDTFRLIGLFTQTANDEATRIIQAPMNYVDAKGNFMRGLAREAGISLYMLTAD